MFDGLSIRAGAGPDGAPFVAFVLSTNDLSVGASFLVDVPGAEGLDEQLHECIAACRQALSRGAKLNGSSKLIVREKP
jgi:hypothetical protein